MVHGVAHVVELDSVGREFAADNSRTLAYPAEGRLQKIWTGDSVLQPTRLFTLTWEKRDGGERDREGRGITGQWPPFGDGVTLPSVCYRVMRARAGFPYMLLQTMRPPLMGYQSNPPQYTTFLAQYTCRRWDTFRRCGALLVADSTFRPLGGGFRREMFQSGRGYTRYRESRVVQPRTDKPSPYSGSTLAVQIHRGGESDQLESSNRCYDFGSQGAQGNNLWQLGHSASLQEPNEILEMLGCERMSQPTTLKLEHSKLSFYPSCAYPYRPSP
ncbi:hypothetical protein R1flu_005521 [Riccia fluitans]|uniref:Uncharacterized protein n=1 Tax=Riccia fluitans TaxID=41844 RepID=A0ABD1YXE6_9MARC